MNEHVDVMDQVRESFSGVRMDLPVENVLARGRARRHRRLAGLTAGAAATAGVATAVTVALGGVAPAHSGNPPTARQSPVRLAAYSVTSGPGSSTTLVLRKGQWLDANALRAALARDGIPALVTVGTFCHLPPGPSAANTLIRNLLAQPSTQADGSDVLVITGSDLPPGTRLSIGYGSSWIRFAVVPDNTPLSCINPLAQPAVRITPPGPTSGG